MNDGIAGKLILQLTGMMSQRPPQSEQKLDFLEIYTWSFENKCPNVSLISRGLAVKRCLARHYRSRANRPLVLGVPPFKSRGVGWVRI